MFDLIITPAVAWAKYKSSSVNNSGSANGSSCGDVVEKELGWQLCCKISDTGTITLTQLAFLTCLWNYWNNKCHIFCKIVCVSKFDLFLDSVCFNCLLTSCLHY